MSKHGSCRLRVEQQQHLVAIPVAGSQHFCPWPHAQTPIRKPRANPLLIGPRPLQPPSPSPPPPDVVPPKPKSPHPPTMFPPPTLPTHTHLHPNPCPPGPLLQACAAGRDAAGGDVGRGRGQGRRGRGLWVLAVVARGGCSFTAEGGGMELLPVGGGGPGPPCPSLCAVLQADARWGGVLLLLPPPALVNCMAFAAGIAAAPHASCAAREPVTPCNLHCHHFPLAPYPVPPLPMQVLSIASSCTLMCGSAPCRRPWPAPSPPSPADCVSRRRRGAAGGAGHHPCGRGAERGGMPGGPEPGPAPKRQPGSEHVAGAGAAGLPTSQQDVREAAGCVGQQ